MSKPLFLVGFLIVLSKCALAQIEQTNRLEIPIDHEFQSFQVSSLDSSGVLVYRRFTGSKGDQLEIARLDTSFQLVWKGFLPISRDLQLASVKIAGKKIYLFLRTVNGKPNFQTTAMNAENGSYVSYEIQNLIPFNPSEFVVTKNALLIGGYFNYRPLVLHYSLLTQKSRVLPGFLNEQGELTQIYSPGDGNVDVIISAKNNKKKSILIKSYDSNGDLIKTVVLEPSDRKSLIFGRAAKVNNDTLVIAGVYGRTSEYSRGVFVAEVNAFGEYVIHYYNFGDLKNFFHYMKAKKESRIKERIQRRKIRGKKIKFNYRLLVHQLLPYQENFVMLGEAFVPRYSTRRTGYPGYQGYPYPGYVYSPYAFAPSSRYYTPYRSDLVFDGFEYTHAVVLCIDAKGKLIWDNSFQINDIRSYQLDQFVKVVPQKDHVLLLYLFENTIRSKVIEGNGLAEGNFQSQLKVSEGNELVGGTAKLQYWYKQRLFIYGTQTIKPTNGGNSKLVFFINKLELK